ncbi:MAG: hypothetical protein DHS20C15_00440 [Planctomycetota bacterium]|nr:MAG: hypothetical protein DHS20C15_00440 [Planctomycetota bacterium]
MVIARALLVLSTLCAVSLAAQQETPDDLAFLSELARDYRRGGSWSAQRELDEYLLDFPESVPARELAARAALQRGRVQQAREHLARLDEPDPRLLGSLLLRAGDYEAVLELAEQLAQRPAASPLWAGRLQVAALDAMGQHNASLTRARELTDAVDDRELDGLGLLDYGWLAFHQRRFELANQALVFADRELNGLAGPDYELRHPEVLVLLGRVYGAARQTGTGGRDRTLEALDVVLDVDSGSADALVVQAATYLYGMNGQLAERALDRALNRDPEHPEALVLRGRTRLLARRVDAALEAADRVLANNPRDRGALALRSAALGLGSDPAAARDARGAFEQQHPESAEAASLLGEVLQSHYRFEESVAPLQEALALETDNEAPLPVLAQSLANLGRFAEAADALQEHERRSPFPYPWRSNMIDLLSARENLPEMLSEDEHFRFVLDPSEREIYGAELGAWLEDVRAEMGARWGYHPEGEVLVEVYDDIADFSVRTVGFEGFLAFGVCFGDVVTILSPLSQMRGQLHWQQTALHEYAHVVTLGISQQRMPRWLSEGISVLEERRHSDRWARPLARDVLDARANGRVFPVERLDEAFQDGRTVMLGYYLGSLVAEIVERDFGFDGLRALVAAYADDLSTREATQRALGVAPEELDRRLAKHIEDTIASKAKLFPRYDEHGKERLRARVQSGDMQALDDLAAAYQALGRTADRDAALTRAERELGVTPLLMRVRAMRAMAAGHRSEALEILRIWSFGSDDDVDADGLLWFAGLLLDAGDRDAALSVLRRARMLHPADIAQGGVLFALLGLLDPDDATHAAERRSVLEDICRYDETAASPRHDLIDIARAAGDTETERQLLAELVALDPYAPGERMRLAEALFDAGEVAAAREHWKVLLALRPTQARRAPQEASPEMLPGFPQPTSPEVGGEASSEAPPVTEPHWHSVARKRLQETASEVESAPDAPVETAPAASPEGRSTGG